MSLNDEINRDEMPYERCKKFGPSVLTDTELLAIFIRSGNKDMSVMSIAKNLIGKNENGKGILELSQKDIGELMSYPGIGEVKAVQISCMLEISKRIWKSCNDEPLVFDSIGKVSNYYKEEMRHLKVEKVFLLLLNTKLMLIRKIELTSGTVNESLINTRDIFSTALKHNAVSIMLMHNHPSGDPEPSRQDIEVTRKINDAGKIIGVRLIDHIVFGDNKYVSMTERGYIV